MRIKFALPWEGMSLLNGGRIHLLVQCLRWCIHSLMHLLSLLIRTIGDAVLMHLIVDSISLLMQKFTGAVSSLMHAFTDALAVFDVAHY